ncbi:MAG TPA: hypothetical protein VFV40_00635 [Nocardioides sp.]|nr:hypothetical protein [Nocardioides sp.]
MDTESGGSPSELLRSLTWWVWLSRWVLQDGNYTDFVAGERRQFALELGYDRSARLQRSPGSPTAACRHSGRDATYDVVGRLLRSVPEPGNDAFVLDFGLRAYAPWMVLDDLRPPGAGEWLAGQISLSVDHFAYMDELAGLPGMPPLIYTWTVEEIRLRTAPPAPDGSALDPHWHRVPRTRAWDEDGEYLLKCSLEAQPPTSSMRATGPGSPYGPLPVGP